MEYENPTTFGAVHHLTVTCYMLQHNAYSRDVWLEARDMLARFIQGGVTPEAMRLHNRSRFDSAHRTWSVTRGLKLEGFDTLVWSRTIADVRPEDPETYCADIRLWAVSLLRDTELLVHRPNSEP